MTAMPITCRVISVLVRVVVFNIMTPVLTSTSFQYILAKQNCELAHGTFCRCDTICQCLAQRGRDYDANCQVYSQIWEKPQIPGPGEAVARVFTDVALFVGLRPGPIIPRVYTDVFACMLTILWPRPSRSSLLNDSYATYHCWPCCFSGYSAIA